VRAAAAEGTPTRPMISISKLRPHSFEIFI
jgi:hypothetical protein